MGFLTFKYFHCHIFEIVEIAIWMKQETTRHAETIKSHVLCSAASQFVPQLPVKLAFDATSKQEIQIDWRGETVLLKMLISFRFW